MKNLGDKIRLLRKQRRLTLAGVSEKTGIDVATLSRIENGKMIGTIKSHMLIAKALDIHLPDLYETALEAEDATLKRHLSQPAAVLSQTDGSVAELLVTGSPAKKMASLRLKLKPASKSAPEEFPLGTERFLYVLKGKIDAVIKDEVNPVGQGESLYFNGSLRHYFANPLKTPSIALIVTTQPAV